MKGNLSVNYILIILYHAAQLLLSLSDAVVSAKRALPPPEANSMEMQTCSERGGAHKTWQATYWHLG